LASANAIEFGIMSSLAGGGTPNETLTVIERLVRQWLTILCAQFSFVQRLLREFAALGDTLTLTSA